MIVGQQKKKKHLVPTLHTYIPGRARYLPVAARVPCDEALFYPDARAKHLSHLLLGLPAHMAAHSSLPPPDHTSPRPRAASLLAHRLATIGGGREGEGEASSLSCQRYPPARELPLSSHPPNPTDCNPPRRLPSTDTDIISKLRFCYPFTSLPFPSPSSTPYLDTLPTRQH
ncbi:hypothetical protein L249_6852 [Ophiocordyceps polyrhachis-furcata BCC 54312]|uniref:Uncharacterized protein n=1 Tax=Ophiocordyceps polyrhachis-furcata BCC 54312 TaxID=1330021 RepID=A0A367LJ97_9HYPO|nr:hypothetical protein L249_6852 [Ophiocordyceps polyrhachis-furcata BCC 54312]